LVPILENIFAIYAVYPWDATFVIDLGNGGEKIVFNSRFHLAPSVKAQGEKLIKEITDGTLTRRNRQYEPSAGTCSARASRPG